MLIIGDSIKLDRKITDNIQTGFYNGKVVPCLCYQGEYIKEVNGNTEYIHENLQEIIEEVIISKNVIENVSNPSFLVTRQIGTDNPNSTLPKDKPQTRVSLIYVENNQIRVWTPTNKEIIQDLKYLCGHAGKEYMTVFKEINNKLSIRRDFSIQGLLENYFDDMSLGIYLKGYAGTVIRGSFGDHKLPVAAFFALIKNILISEDMRFDGCHHLGRYRFQLAALDYVLGNKPIEAVL
ncbi:hypothetical protein [Metabacillus iocasae]|uniref:Uncharacterized protein n=1 Tax=Priestia iocasae TaxID=2291674 RepID=A0ABS2QS99_9BACI|nr:hypothetical protein [Metabacillus iocasae]MBM7702302.1 hypothetical protein [Metabacillus iocasae]